jgi:hypothetical protein
VAVLCADGDRAAGQSAGEAAKQRKWRADNKLGMRRRCLQCSREWGDIGVSAIHFPVTRYDLSHSFDSLNYTRLACGAHANQPITLRMVQRNKIP